MAKEGPAASDERRIYWQAAIELQQQSGLSIRKFCQQEGLAESAFYFWRRELVGRDERPRRAAPQPAAKFVSAHVNRLEAARSLG